MAIGPVESKSLGQSLKSQFGIVFWDPDDNLRYIIRGNGPGQSCKFQILDLGFKNKSHGLSHFFLLKTETFENDS